MRTKEDDIMKLKNNQWKWDRWLEQVQIRTLQNWTQTGWEVVSIDQAVHSRVLQEFKQEHKCIGYGDEFEGKPRNAGLHN